MKSSTVLEQLPALVDYLRSRAAVKPFRPPSFTQERIFDLLARGWSYKRIALRLGMSARTVQTHVNQFAVMLPEDGLPARERVQIWAGCVAWDRDHTTG
jgi:hypothetical protein